MEDLVMQEILSYYKGKKVFITGHTGFKGAWLMACLHLAGAKIKGFALAPAYDGLYSLLEPENIAENVLSDIRQANKLEDAILNFQPDFIFHLAAQPLVRRSYAIPSETFAVNVVGTSNLLETVTRLKSRCTVVVVTTDKVYENKEQHILYKEGDRLGGYDPYSASKACTEIVAGSFLNSFFNKKDYENHLKTLVTARAGNVIGGGDWSEDRILPDIIRSLQKQQEIKVRNPFAIRPWQHVLEPLTGYLLLAAVADKRSTPFANSYNFGPLPEDHMTVKELVEVAIASWGQGKWIDASEQDAVHEAGLLQLDINLAMKDLKWKPKLSAKQAIEWTVNWYRQPMDKKVSFTFQQIKEYLSL